MTKEVERQMVGIDEWYVKTKETIYSTTLGSCVSVILWDPVGGISAMNHFLLPNRRGDDVRDRNLDLKEPHELMTAMIDQALKKGAQIFRLKALVVGGAEANYDHYRVGVQNVQMAVSVLEAYRIKQYRVIAGGNYSRKVQFDSSEGTVTIHKIAIGKRDKGEEEIIYLGGVQHDIK